jgi:hypothetical protein
MSIEGYGATGVVKLTEDSKTNAQENIVGVEPSTYNIVIDSLCTTRTSTATRSQPQYSWKRTEKSPKGNKRVLTSTPPGTNPTLTLFLERTETKVQNRARRWHLPCKCQPNWSPIHGRSKDSWQDFPFFFLCSLSFLYKNYSIHHKL